MIPDPFASSTFSLILSWVFGFFVFLVILLGIISSLSEEGKARYRLVVLWVMICAAIFSPVRYLLLQLLMSETYFVQSGSAFISTLILVLYMPIVFGILHAIGIGVPLLAIGLIAGLKEPMSRMRIGLGLICCPALFYIGSITLFWLLPYAAYSTHWLRAKDLMQATNGPAEYYYEYIVDINIPYLPNWIAGNVGETPKERLRSHLAELYIGKEESRVLTGYHFNSSINRSNEAARIIGTGEGLIKAIPAEDYARKVELHRAAIREARKVDIAVLNERCPTFGDKYRDLFIKGMTKLIEGYETPDDRMLIEGNWKMLQAQSLLDQWGDWYTANRDAIQREP